MRPRIYISIFATIGIFSARADDDLPKKLNFDRYKGMLDHSPFAVASAVVAPAATPNFAKDLYIANAAKAPDGDTVTLASSSDKEFKKYLTNKEPVDGYSIANIEWSEKVGETKVTISKDGQFATLTFNQALLSQSAAGGGPGGRLVAPSGPVPNPAALPKSPANIPPELQQLIPSREAMQPRTRGAIQRNPRTSKGPPGGGRPSRQ